MPSLISPLPGGPQAEALDDDQALRTPTPTTATQPATGRLTVIVPAYNEAESIAETLLSLREQTLPAEEIIVVDDCSTDGTTEVARACGATVLRPPHNTGSKAGAQNFALDLVRTEFTMAVDADTTLAPDAIEKLLGALAEPGVAAACGFVLPRQVRTLWERGRYIDISSPSVSTNRSRTTTTSR
jgi:biofilm PGA synthesis N-glycosyltransferase PgaC